MMKHQPITVLRYISLLQRNTQRYFDLALERDNIGGGDENSWRKLVRATDKLRF